MNRIIKIGMDVHSTSYTLCALEDKWGEDAQILASLEVEPNSKSILLFIASITDKFKLTKEDDIECGYEAGCLGYSLYNQLTEAGVKCVILAPSTMPTPQGKRVKTDARDARQIADCLIHRTFHAVYIPKQQDDEVKEFIRMRDDHNSALKKVKQQISAFCLRHGYTYDSGKKKWTGAHLKWLRKLELPAGYQEVLDEYLATYEDLVAKIDRFDDRIRELSEQECYQEKVQMLRCFLGIETHTALCLLVETGDFHRFAKGNIYASYLGLAPGENSSGESVKRLPITKAGNSHLRKLLIESAQGICKGKTGHKSKALAARQKGNPPDVISYADRANSRLRSKYYRMIHRGKNRNTAVTAIARELACFVWGMVTDHRSPRPV